MNIRLPEEDRGELHRLAGGLPTGDGLQFEKFLVLVIQNSSAISAAPRVDIQKRPGLYLRPLRAHLVNDSAVNHFGAYAGIADDLDMEVHGGVSSMTRAVATMKGSPDAAQIRNARAPGPGSAETRPERRPTVPPGDGNWQWLATA